MTPARRHRLGVSVGAKKLVLQLDYVDRQPPIHRDPADRQRRSLRKQYEEVRIQVAVRTVRLEIASATRCWSVSRLDELLAKHAVRPRDGRWYAHGIVVPCCSDCPSGWGFLRPDAAGRRENFVVVTRNLSSDERLHAAVHELAHILNLHHRELVKDEREARAAGVWSATRPFGRHCRRHFEEMLEGRRVSLRRRFAKIATGQPRRAAPSLGVPALTRPPGSAAQRAAGPPRAR